MPVGGGEHPVSDLGLEEGPHIVRGTIAGFENAQISRMPGRRRIRISESSAGQRLAKILLRQSRDPSAGLRARSNRSTARTFGAKLDDLARCGVQIERLHHSRAKPLISTESFMSIWRWPTNPSGSLSICVVGVAPSGGTISRGGTTMRSSPALLRGRSGTHRPPAARGRGPGQASRDRVLDLRVGKQLGVDAVKPVGVSPSGSNWTRPRSRARSRSGDRTPPSRRFRTANGCATGCIAVRQEIVEVVRDRVTTMRDVARSERK